MVDSSPKDHLTFTTHQFAVIIFSTPLVLWLHGTVNVHDYRFLLVFTSQENQPTPTRPTIRWIFSMPQRCQLHHHDNPEKVVKPVAERVERLELRSSPPRSAITLGRWSCVLSGWVWWSMGSLWTKHASKLIHLNRHINYTVSMWNSEDSW